MIFRQPKALNQLLIFRSIRRRKFKVMSYFVKANQIFMPGFINKSGLLPDKINEVLCTVSILVMLTFLFLIKVCQFQATGTDFRDGLLAPQLNLG